MEAHTSTKILRVYNELLELSNAVVCRPPRSDIALSHSLHPLMRLQSTDIDVAKVLWQVKRRIKEFKRAVLLPPSVHRTSRGAVGVAVDCSSSLCGDPVMNCGCGWEWACPPPPRSKTAGISSSTPCCVCPDRDG